MKKWGFIFLLFSLNLIFSSVAKKESLGDWCGTIPALIEFLKDKPLQRPSLSGPVEYIEREKFRVHYTRQGADAVTHEYAEAVANHTEYSWRKQADSLGWAEAPPDYGLGGDDRYDIYLKSLPAGIAGMCVVEYSYPNPYPDGATSHIRISNQLGSEFLKIVCAHELNHAFQFRYSAREERFWYENTATWMEDICFDNVNSYVSYFQTQPNPLANPEYPITTFTNVYQYAGGIWAMFLSDRYHLDCVKRVWERQGLIGGTNTLEAFDYVLRNYYSSNLTTALKEYGLWRYFTGARADTIRYFKEGHLWPLVRFLRTHSSYPAQGTQYPDYPQGPGGTNYIQFTNGGGKLTIFFDGQDYYNWASLVVGYKSGLLPLISEIQLNPQMQGRDSFNWHDRDHFTLIPVVTEWEYATGYLSFEYSASVRITRDVSVERLEGFPSPMGDSGSVIFPKALLKNYGLYSENFPCRLTVGNFYSDIQNLTLNPGETIMVHFRPCTLRTRNFNTYLCTTLLIGDEKMSNDFKSGQIFIRVKDAGSVAIVEPSGNVTQGSYIRPKARIKNFGNIREEFVINFTIGDFKTQKRIGIAAGLESLVVFDTLWPAFDTGRFIVKCSTALSGDMNPTNDKVTGECYVHPPGLSEDAIALNKERASFFSTPTNKDFLPQVKLEVFDIRGRKIKKIGKGVYILYLKEHDKTASYKVIVIR